MDLVDAAVVFGVSLAVGTVAILVGVKLVVDRDAGVLNASFVALLGALVWVATAFYLEPISLLGAVTMLVVWIAVVHWRYPGGWGSSVGIAFVAWIVAVAIVYALGFAGVVEVDVIGVPAGG